MSNPDEMSPKELAEVNELMQGTPALKRWELLKQLHEEHKEHIQLNVTLAPDPGAPDPDRAPMKVTVTWHITARGISETQRWDAYVRFEVKRRLGVEEPTSITDEQAGRLGIKERIQ